MAAEEAKKIKGSKLVIASNNAGKVKEISELLAPYDIEVISASSFDYPEPIETGSTFIENAEIKSKYYALKTGLPALSDDSGLEVMALDGAPGVYSADWAGNPRDFNKAMNMVEEKLNDLSVNTRGSLTEKERENLRANFTCLLSLCLPDGTTQNFEGQVFGHLQFPPRGSKGFGYDAIFVPDDYIQTFAEIDSEEKQRISHRANAFKKFLRIFEVSRKSA